MSVLLCRFGFGALVLSLVVMPAVATGPSEGFIEARIDGEPHRWVAMHTANGEHLGSSFTFTSLASAGTRYTLQGHLSPEGPAMTDVLALELVIDGGRAKARLVEASLSWFETGMLPHWTSEHGGQLQVELDRVEPGADITRLAGSFEARLVRRLDMQTVDRKRHRTISGRFEAAAVKAGIRARPGESRGSRPRPH